MALYNVASTLNPLVKKLRIQWDGELFDLNRFAIGACKAKTENFDAVIYVCGPLHPPVAQFLLQFQQSIRIGVGISQVGDFTPSDCLDVFHLRDSDTESSFDLALANIGYPHLAAAPLHKTAEIATCLVGKQSEYGDLDGHNSALKVVNSLVAEVSAISVQTLLHQKFATPYVNEIALQAGRVLLTTRMHASLIGLFHRIPVLSIDQIRGSAKVTRMMTKIGYPVFNIWETSTEELQAVLYRLSRRTEPSSDRKWRHRIIKQSRLALRDSIATIVKAVS